MSKKDGSPPRVIKGEKNPRHYIMIPIGTGNKYCRNCSNLRGFKHRSRCNVFPREIIVFNSKMGAERCKLCLDAELLIEIKRAQAEREGANRTFYQGKYVRDRTSGTLNMRTV